MKELISWVYYGDETTPDWKFRTETENMALGAILVHQQRSFDPESVERTSDIILEGTFDKEVGSYVIKKKRKRIKELILDITLEKYECIVEIYYCWNTDVDKETKKEIDLESNYEVRIQKIIFDSDYDEEFEEEEFEDGYEQ